MTKEEFKKTIEYKRRIRPIKLMTIIILCSNIIIDVIAVIFYFSFKELNSDIAIIVLITLILFALLRFPFHILYIRKEIKYLRNLLNYMDTMYVFEYKLKLPIEHKSIQSKYFVSFNYNGEKHELTMIWIYDSNNLNYQRVNIGYVEELDIILVLNKVE